MNRRTAAIRTLARALLWLHPRAFRADYTDEILSVLADTLTEASGHGGSAVLLAGLREILGLCGSLLRQRWDGLPTCRPETPGVSARNALILAVAFATLRLTPGAWSWATLSIDVITGAFVGWLLRPTLRGSLRTFERLGFGIAALLGGELITGAANAVANLWYPAEPPAWLLIVAFTMEPFVLGSCCAWLLARISGIERPSPTRSLQSGLPFGFGALGGLALTLLIWGLSQAVDSHRVGFDGTLSAWVIDLNSGLLRFGVPLVAGWIGGAGLGRAPRNRQRAGAIPIVS